MNQPICPNCNAVLKKFPARKTKCPSCGADIHIKRAPGEHVKRLVTTEQAQQIEAQWAAVQGRDEQLRVLQSFGIGEQEYDRTKAMLSSHGFAAGSDSLDWKTIYFLLNEIASKATDIYQRRLAFDQLGFMCMRKGLKFRDYFVRAREAELLQYKATNGIVVDVEIRSGEQHGICQACQGNTGKRFTIEEALQKAPLPCRDCTCPGLREANGFCRCYYRTILRSEVGG